MYNKSISLAVPVFNEEEIIEETIDIFTDKLSAITDDFEIIIINDGSSDSTGDILNRISSRNQKIKVFHNEKNLGSGISLWLGFKEATKELVLSNFADRPFDLNDLKNILPLFDSNNIDFVIVVRKNRKANTLFRKLTSYVNFLLIRLLFNIKIDDFQFVQIYRSEIIKNLNLISSGTFLVPELIVRLFYLGYKHREVRCEFYKRPKGKSKCGRPSEYFRTIKEMIVFRFHYNSLKKGFIYVC